MLCNFFYLPAWLGGAHLEIVYNAAVAYHCYRKFGAIKCLHPKNGYDNHKFGYVRLVR